MRASIAISPTCIRTPGTSTAGTDKKLDNLFMPLTSVVLFLLPLCTFSGTQNISSLLTLTCPSCLTVSILDSSHLPSQKTPCVLDNTLSPQALISSCVHRFSTLVVSFWKTSLDASQFNRALCTDPFPKRHNTSFCCYFMLKASIYIGRATYSNCISTAEQ